MIWVPIEVVMETFYRLHTYPLSYDLGSYISRDRDILVSTNVLTELPSGLQYKRWLRHFRTNAPTNWAMICVPIKVVMETFYRLYTYPLSSDLCSNISGDIGILASTHLLTELQSGLQYK